MNQQEMMQRITELQQKVAELERQLGEARNELDARPPLDELIEYEGALFQKKIGGGYRKAIFCLNCRRPMTSVADRTHFMCLHCRHEAHFPGLNIADIICELPPNK
ncbi:MAG: hypothetical protein KJZ78_14525 [Bryobacteraceae bacterium]|nr:hypothetical protein [Bryobacteraceae bacterium]